MPSKQTKFEAYAWTVCATLAAIRRETALNPGRRRCSGNAVAQCHTERMQRPCEPDIPDRGGNRPRPSRGSPPEHDYNVLLRARCGSADPSTTSRDELGPSVEPRANNRPSAGPRARRRVADRRFVSCVLCQRETTLSDAGKGALRVPLVQEGSLLCRRDGVPLVHPFREVRPPQSEFNDRSLQRDTEDHADNPSTRVGARRYRGPCSAHCRYQLRDPLRRDGIP